MPRIGSGNSQCMKILFRKFKQSRLVIDSLKLTSSNVLLYVLPLIVTPILSRVYLPEDFGDWGVFSSTIIILSVILLGGYEYAIIRCEDNEVEHMCAVAGLTGVIITIGVGVLWCIGRLLDISYFVNFPSILLLYLLITVFLVILQNLANREKKYGLMSVVNISMGGLQALLRILFGTLILIPFGLIHGTVWAHLFALIIIIVGFRGILSKLRYSSYNLKSIRIFFVKYKKFPLYDAPSSLLAFATFNLPIIILSLYYNKADIGCYSMVIQLLLLPVSFIGAAIGKVYYQQISVCQSYEISNKTLKVLNFSLLISSLPLIIICLGGDYLITIFLGSKWEMAGIVALCLSIWSVPTIITQPVMSIYRASGKQDRMLLLNIVYFLLGIGSLLIVCHLKLSLKLTIVIYAVMCAIGQFLFVFDIIHISGLLVSRLYKPSVLLLVVSIIIYICRISITIF